MPISTASPVPGEGAQSGWNCEMAMPALKPIFKAEESDELVHGIVDRQLAAECRQRRCRPHQKNLEFGD